MFVELKLKERVIDLQLNQATKADAKLLDGCYGIETDVRTSQSSAHEV